MIQLRHGPKAGSDKGNLELGVFSHKTIGVCLLAFLLQACMGSGNNYVSPANIKPVHQIRNAPSYPVPLPKMRPSRTAKKAIKKPAPRKYVAQASTRLVKVRKGDTLYALSRRYNVPVRDLVRVNKLRAPFALALGQKIRLPSANVHVVKKGETSYAIAQKYAVRLSDLIKVNRIRPPYTLAMGQKLKLPGGARASAAPKRQYASKSSKSRPSPVRKYIPPPKTGKYFMWPVQGPIISRFGPKKGGVHNDGINMTARKGSAIRAAEAGVVAYASNDLPGYGNLILVKHSGNWVTAYAHTENMTVKAGQIIKKGQTIARVGNTGGVQKPQLHFEIRRGRRALNPLLYLERRKTASGR